MPRPVDFLLRVTVASEAPVEGTMIFADIDSLVMFDRTRMQRVTVHPDSSVLLELYQGQQRTARAVVKGSAKGALVGAAVGVGEALASSLLGKILGWSIDVEEATKAGIFLGATTGAYAGGAKAANEGEAMWERVTLLQLRQQLCHCPEPDRGATSPKSPLIPSR
jgi:hypothetical protein